MNKHYVIRLTSEEREQQHEMVAKGKTAAQGIRHAHILPAGSAACSAALLPGARKPPCPGPDKSGRDSGRPPLMMPARAEAPGPGIAKMAVDFGVTPG